MKDMVTVIPSMISWLKPSMSCTRLRDDDEGGCARSDKRLTEDQSAPRRR